MKQFELKVVDDAILKGNCWEIDNPKACIVIFSGMEECVYRYDEFASFLNDNGYSVYGLDVYGQGDNIKDDLSNAGIWPNEGFAKQVIANNMLVEKLQKEGKKVFIFAHSMGSFMCQDYIQRFSGSVEKVVLCGSGAKVDIAPLGLMLAKMICTKKKANQKAKFLNSLMFGNFNNKIKNPKTPFDWLSYNEANVEKYIADPKCGYGPRNSFCYEFLKGIARCYNKNSLKKINKEQQIFLITGDMDPVTGYTKFTAKLQRMYAKLGLKNVSAKIYPHMRHEILNEDNKQEVFKDVLEYFNA